MGCAGARVHSGTRWRAVTPFSTVWRSPHCDAGSVQCRACRGIVCQLCVLEGFPYVVGQVLVL